METKRIEIEVPAGKTAKWIDGVLMLVDEKVKDTRPITERVKTFENACRELGEDHALVEQWVGFSNSIMADMDDTGNDIVAYMKLRIICAALNEGWKPEFTENEHRYYPWFCLYTQNEIEEMSEYDRKELVLWGGNASYGASCGLASATSHSGFARAGASFCSRLCLKSEKLAIYCGKQFIDIWADFVL